MLHFDRRVRTVQSSIRNVSSSSLSFVHNVRNLNQVLQQIARCVSNSDTHFLDKNIQTVLGSHRYVNMLQSLLQQWYLHILVEHNMA
jgi:hypothetical protein